MISFQIIIQNIHINFDQKFNFIFLFITNFFITYKKKYAKQGDWDEIKASS